MQTVSQSSEPTHQTGTGHPETMSMTSEIEMGYFNTFSSDLLVQAIKNCMKEVKSPWDRLPEEEVTSNLQHIQHKKDSQDLYLRGR